MINNDFWSQVINGIESVAHKKLYNIIITQTHECYEREVLALDHLFLSSVDGILVSLSAETDNVEHFKEVHNKGLPIVFFDRITNEINTHKVSSDNFKGAYEATQHLIQQGFKRIAHVTSSNNLSITLERLEGYIKALEDNGFQVNENYIKYCFHGGMIGEETEKAVHELLTMKDRPDAIFTASDRLTLTTFSILHKLKIKIPDEIALVGFTNSVSADIFDPGLSSVVQPAFEIGQAAAEMLIATIESKRPVTNFEKRTLENKLEIRETSINHANRKKLVELHL